MILEYSITIFFTQLIFIGCRTWNVKAISKKDMKGALISGTFVHLSWLVSIGIGTLSIHELMKDFRLEFIPVLLCSLIGGLLGTYIGLKERFKS